MPNQLAEAKKRKTVAEHAAVLALLDRIASKEHTTSTELIRKAARDSIRRHAEDPRLQNELRELLQTYEPKLPSKTKDPKALTRFKQNSREFDALAVDLGLRRVEDLQRQNSLHKESSAPVLIGSL